MKDPGIKICALIESRMNNLIDKINETDSIIEADPLDSELRTHQGRRQEPESGLPFRSG